MKKIYVAIISLICFCSLGTNAAFIQSWLNTKHQMQYEEANAMQRFASEISTARAYMPSNRNYAIAMLTEAGGVVLTLRNVIPTSSKATSNNLYNVGYYLHFQGTVTSFDGISQFMINANELLQSHVSNGQYNISYFSSDTAKLSDMLPASFH